LQTILVLAHSALHTERDWGNWLDCSFCFCCLPVLQSSMVDNTCSHRLENCFIWTALRKIRAGGTNWERLTWSHFSVGLQELFTSPNLRKITDDPLFVSSIQHQSTLELKEDGVEASAATSVAISRSVSAFSLDRPFVFIIFEDETGIPLFIGSVQNPNPNAAPQIKEPQDSREATDVNEYPMPK